MAKITKEMKKEIEEFFEVLEKVAAPSDPRSRKPVYDLGLVIFDKASKEGSREIFNLLPKGKARFFLLNIPYGYDDFLKELVIAIREGQWLVVDCQADPSPTIIGILKQLSEDNAFTVTHFEGKGLFRMELNPKTRIIFCLNSEFLETKITYPYFMNFFGSVIRI